MKTRKSFRRQKKQWQRQLERTWFRKLAAKPWLIHEFYAEVCRRRSVNP